LSGWCESGVCYFPAADVIVKAQAVLSELLRTMFDVGYFTRRRNKTGPAQRR
jgi:hypothetical protein